MAEMSLLCIGNVLSDSCCRLHVVHSSLVSGRLVGPQLVYFVVSPPHSEWDTNADTDLLLMSLSAPATVDRIKTTTPNLTGPDPSTKRMPE